MNVRPARPWAVLLLGATLCVGAVAQKAPDDPNQPLPVPGQVLSDVQPLPAEDRESQGAVLLHDSKVRAQRKLDAFTAAGERTGVPSVIGRNVSRVLDRAREGDSREAEVAPAWTQEPEPTPPPMPAPNDPALR